MFDGHAASLRQAIEEQSRQLGFDLFGVTSPDPTDHLKTYLDWLQAGRHGEMSYLSSASALSRRANPLEILPECRSILVLGIRYYASGQSSGYRDADESHPSGRVASYAWGEDYHDVLAARLRSLVAFIESFVGHPVQNRWYTDTGPLLERDLAQRAGLGWIGKNTCLIHPAKGSYFLLAEVLLGERLPLDSPFPFDRCGSCTRCLDACPTSCILPDRTIDARKCLSYLTIELKGSIPEELRPLAGDWVFGCDICQQVCPWNQRFPGSQGDSAFAPRPDVPQPDLIQELGLTTQAFNQKFHKNPVKRAKRRGYLRNVAVALGNAHIASSITALAVAISDPEPLVRIHAAWALGQIKDQSANIPPTKALQNESDPDVLREIHNALQKRGVAPA